MCGLIEIGNEKRRSPHEALDCDTPLEYAQKNFFKDLGIISQKEALSGGGNELG